MNRYGFNAEEIDDLSNKFKTYPHLTIKSLCSHLAATDDKTKDVFTQNQIEKFNSICNNFDEKLNIILKGISSILQGFYDLPKLKIKWFD